MAFVEGLKTAVDVALVEIREVDAHINTATFIEAVVDAFDEFEEKSHLLLEAK